MSTGTAPGTPASSNPGYRFIGRVLLKTALLFLLFNLAYVVLHPLPALGRLSLYNHLLPGRLRLPYSDDPARSFNMSIPQLDAMFASHIIDGTAKTSDEFRVLLIGDSSVWGYLLKPTETLSARLNALNLQSSDGRLVRVYNLGYPTSSVTKDLLLLRQGLTYKPDLILWFVTLESLPWPQQLQSPLLELNPQATDELIEQAQLPLTLEREQDSGDGWWGRTMLGERRQLADWIRFQLYGIAWAATSVDQAIPETYNRRMEDLPADLDFQTYHEGELGREELAFDVLKAGIAQAGDVPLVFINEPIFVSRGENSELRYNFYYPRWAYDSYRSLLNEVAEEQAWRLLDLWDAVPPGEFTDSAIHYSPQGVEILVRALAKRIAFP